jgi:hypothetical protein
MTQQSNRFSQGAVNLTILFKPAKYLSTSLSRPIHRNPYRHPLKHAGYSAQFVVRPAE